MSAYDYVKNPVTNEYDQIKVWNNEMHHYDVNNTVPTFTNDGQDYDNYSIIMREGYVIRVENCHITFIGYGVMRAFDEVPFFDKWGIPFTAHTEGLMGEPYFLNSMKLFRRLDEKSS
jgi:hypothetical protein